MSDEPTKPAGQEDKPKKQPRVWPGRPGGSVPAPAAAPQEAAAAAEAAAPAAESAAPETLGVPGAKKQPKIWKGGTGAAKPAAPAAASTAAAPAASAARVAAPAAAAPAKIAATAKPPAPYLPIPKKPEAVESEGRMIRRRRFAISCIFAFLTANLLMFLRFFFPRVLFEPKSIFKIGYPTDFGFGVDTKFQKDFRIWVVRNAEGMFVIYARCTHLGCTPDWIASENKFKCPCHGSGYDSEGINFEGPAPRPMDRAKVELDADGQVVVDTSKLYQWPKGGQSQFKDKGSFLQT